MTYPQLLTKSNKKGTRKSTQHPSDIVPLNWLSSQHKNFLTNLKFIIVPKIVEKALWNEKWAQIMKEQMNALGKN